MGNVAVLFKVYADGGSEEQVLKGIENAMHPKSARIEEIGFGIKIIKVLFVHDDSVGSTDFENQLSRITGVNNVEVDEETLIS